MSKIALKRAGETVESLLSCFGSIRETRFTATLGPVGADSMKDKTS